MKCDKVVHGKVGHKNATGGEISQIGMEAHLKFNAELSGAP